MVVGPPFADRAAAGRTAILVDDGIATGASMKAALTAIRRRAPCRIIIFYYHDFHQLDDAEVVALLSEAGCH
jgi:putative phosphoribosyl transferase